MSPLSTTNTSPESPDRTEMHLSSPDWQMSPGLPVILMTDCTSSRGAYTYNICYMNMYHIYYIDNIDLPR